MTGSACVRASLSSSARQNVEALVGQVLGETGSILGWGPVGLFRNVFDCARPEKSFFWWCLVLERTLCQEGLVGYNLTVWIRETQLNLLRGLEGAGVQLGAGR